MYFIENAWKYNVAEFLSLKLLHVSVSIPPTIMYHISIVNFSVQCNLHSFFFFLQPPHPQPQQQRRAPVTCPKPNIPKVRAKYDFKPQEEGELPLSFGDIIVVLDKSDENWWRGECNGKKGMFPAPYVEEIK